MPGLIEKRGGKPLVLSDVADVVEDTWPLMGDAVINDGEGLMLIVEKLPWGNTLDVTRGVEAAVDQMQPGLPGMEIDTTIFRPATFVEVAIENLSRALLIGSLLVILILIAFLFDWRSAVISAVAIPLSLLAAGYVLGTRAGRERYQQLTASAKRLADDPSVQRLQEELNGLFGSAKERVADSAGTTVQRVTDQAADKVQQARQRTGQS